VTQRARQTSLRPYRKNKMKRILLTARALKPRKLTQSKELQLKPALGKDILCLARRAERDAARSTRGAQMAGSLVPQRLIKPLRRRRASLEKSAEAAELKYEWTIEWV